jgi:glycosyltransferase involved in cell wall biosynthesis
VRIVYFLESTELWGGVKNVFDQAKALEGQGHEVAIKSKQGDHNWYPYPLKIDYFQDLNDARLPGEGEPDVVVATFWTTVLPAISLGCTKTFHLCQGYEGDFAEFANSRHDIESAYRTPIVKITNGEWLNRILENHFGTEMFKMYVVPPIVDINVYKPCSWLNSKWKSRKSHPPKVFIVGLFTIPGKAIADALRATELLRQMDVDIQVVRASPIDSSEEEKSRFQIDEYHTALNPKEMARLYQESDIFLSSSLSQEGFGLPFAEALACGIPSVVTDILPYTSHDPVQDYALFVPEHDPEAMAHAAMKIIRDQNIQKRLRKRGPNIIWQKYRSELIAKKLEKVFMEG